MARMSDSNTNIEDTATIDETGLSSVTQEPKEEIESVDIPKVDSTTDETTPITEAVGSTVEVNETENTQGESNSASEKFEESINEPSEEARPQEIIEESTLNITEPSKEPVSEEIVSDNVQVTIEPLNEAVSEEIFKESVPTVSEANPESAPEAPHESNIPEIEEPKTLSSSITVAEAPKVANEEQTTNIEDFINQKPESEDLKGFSDDDIIIDGISSDSDSSNSNSSDSDSESDSDSDSEVDSKSVNNADVDDSDEEGETISGPIISRNEVLNEVAPTLPEDYAIPENAPIEPIGTITALVENSVVIKANISGEFRVLKDQSVFCFEDRSVIGPLYETFGRLQNPVYRVKFNTVEEFENFKDSKGKTVYYVVPDSNFIYTDSIKNLKGTDASNCHDEELPEEEQEFSDDEKELEMKQSKKKNKKNKKKAGEEGTPKEANKKRQNEQRSEADPKRFQPYGYAQPQAPQTSTQQYHPRNIPAYTPVSQNSPHVGHQTHQNYNNPQAYNSQLAFQHQQSAQASPYGVPFSQAQAQFTPHNHHQAYNQMQQQQSQAYSNPNLPPYPGQFNAYGNQNFAQNNGYNQWNQQNYQGQQQQQPAQSIPGQQQYIPTQFQQSQLQQLQQLLANQLKQQNSAQPPNQPYQQHPPQ